MIHLLWLLFITVLFMSTVRVFSIKLFWLIRGLLHILSISFMIYLLIAFFCWLIWRCTGERFETTMLLSALFLLSFLLRSWFGFLKLLLILLYLFLYKSFLLLLQRSVICCESFLQIFATLIVFNCSQISAFISASRSLSFLGLIISVLSPIWILGFMIAVPSLWLSLLSFLLSATLILIIFVFHRLSSMMTRYFLLRTLLMLNLFFLMFRFAFLILARFFLLTLLISASLFIFI